VTEEQIGAFLEECAPLLGAAPHLSTAVFLEPPTSQPSTMVRPAGPVPNELGARIETFEAVKACLDAIDNRTDDPRDRWLRILFAVADAGRLGCPDAHDLALEWSRRGAGWTSETDFETDWHSWKPGGISAGSLLAAGKEAGVDLSAWRDTALVRLQPAAGVVPLGPAAPTASGPPQRRRSVQVSALPAVPPKRQWLHGTDALRGAVTLFVAPGGRGKSTWLIGLALACASGRKLFGAHVFGGPLRVLVLSAEDPTAEVARRVRAAMHHHGLTDQDVAGLHIIGANDWGLSLLRAVGNTPALDQRGWDALNAELDNINPDILILDPLLSLLGGVDGNNNSAAAVLMAGLVKLAAERHMAVIVAHHTAKGRDPTSAESAMGAASFVNFSRIGLSVEPLAEKNAARIGVAPWEAKSFFRVTGVKQNFSAPDVDDRWFRYVSVELPNQQPPIYPAGDKVAVVEVFQPGVSMPAYPPAMIRVLKAIDSANPPLSPSKQAKGRYAVDVIAHAIAHHRGGKMSDVETEGVLGYIQHSGLAAVQSVNVPRPGSRADVRKGLVVTPEGKAAMRHPTQPASQARGPRSPRSLPAGTSGTVKLRTP
jgi:hypothetical protein